MTPYSLIRTVLCTAICLQASLTFAQKPDAPASQLKSLLDRVWEYEIQQSPLLATNIGDERFQDRLADVSLTALKNRTAKRRDFLRELNAIELDALSDLAQVDHVLLQRRLEQQIADFDFKNHLMPISKRDGFHIEFPELPRLMNPKTPADFDNYIARLDDFGRFTDQQIELLRGGIQAGLTQPSVIMRESVQQAEAHIVDDPRQSLLLSGISDDAKNKLDDETWSAIEERIIASIQTTVIPAFQRFKSFLESEYLPACRGPIGAAAMPGGREFYRDRIRKFTTLDFTPEQLHETGIRENARIRKEMNAIRSKVGFDGELPAFLQHLRTDPKFYPKSADELMKAAALILKTADGRLPDMFGRLPRTPYGLREIPAHVAPQTTSAYYWPPSTDGKRAGMYYLNTYNLSSRPLYQLESLSLHEAVPGHHLQLALQAELTNLHPISRESSITAFIEGWALYSERLGLEMGFFTDPYQDFGRLSMEAWRASRLVVDTGIHYLGWTRQQAIDYMTENTALSPHNIVAEVDRYIGWPGQALAYKVGELEISSIRRDAETELGEKFDLRTFHDKVLEVGAIPIPLLKKRISRWVASVE
ncbi:DUF885 domain-containing protein [Stieleria marina]|uniref:DUF885 domain-containing protein n=1 Tax=Stieleria marina TaxID=1930275 RepID=A0A517P1B9_9BACT|nr:hypothetical protein K239x_51910 [Planctomycetes bacterium K23_9]